MLALERVNFRLPAYAQRTKEKVIHTHNYVIERERGREREREREGERQCWHCNVIMHCAMIICMHKS